MSGVTAGVTALVVALVLVVCGVMAGRETADPNRTRRDFCSRMDTQLAQDVNTGRYLCYKEGLIIP